MRRHGPNHTYSGISTIKASGILLLRFTGYFLKRIISSLKYFFHSLNRNGKKLIMVLIAVMMLQSVYSISVLHLPGPCLDKYSLTVRTNSSLAFTPPKHWNNPDNTSGIHWGGLILGLFLPVIGFFLAGHKKNKAMANRKKWSIIGSAIALGLIMIALISKKTKF